MNLDNKSVNWRRFWPENKQPRFYGSGTGKSAKGSRIVKCVPNRPKKKCMTFNSISEFTTINHAVSRDLQKQWLIQLAMQTHSINQQLHCYTLLIMYSKERVVGDADRQKELNKWVEKRTISEEEWWNLSTPFFYQALKIVRHCY